MKKAMFCALAACTLAAGCATGPETSTESTPVRAEPEYQTGSNLPKRAGSNRNDVRIVTPEALDRVHGGKGSGASN